MRKLLLAIILLVANSCSEDVKYRWYHPERLNSFRIDDDSEYHFSTDYNAESDIFKSNVIIIRKDTIPTVYYQQFKCGSGDCFKTPKEWTDKPYGSYKIVIPENYVIETFND